MADSWRARTVTLRMLLDSDSDDETSAPVLEEAAPPYPGGILEPDECSPWNLDPDSLLRHIVAMEVDQPAAAAEPEPDRESGPEPMQVSPPSSPAAQVPDLVVQPSLGSELSQLAVLVERYHKDPFLNPKPPTLLELRSMITLCPAKVIPFVEADEPCKVRDKSERVRGRVRGKLNPQPRGTVQGVSFNCWTGMYDGFVSMPGHLESLQKMKQVYCGGSRKGFLQAARWRDSLVVKMYQCGTRWRHGSPAKLNFPPEDALELLRDPRVVPMGFREYAEYLQTEVADKRTLREVPGFTGVYFEAEDDEEDEGFPRRRRDTKRVVAAVFDPDVGDGVGARRALDGPLCSGKPGAKKAIYWDTPEQAARAYDREIIRMGALLVYRLNHPLTDYSAELKRCKKLGELADELMRFADTLKAA